MDKAKSEIRRVVAAKQAVPRKRLGNLVRGLDAAGSAMVIASLSGRTTSSADHEEPQQCPVCEQQGWLICGIEQDFASIPGEGEAIDNWVRRTAHPFAFECPVCELTLQSDELLEMNFPTEIELEPEDPYETYEPDEDLFRGR